MKIKCNYYNILFLLLVFIIMMAGTYIRFILLFHSPSFFSDEVSLLLNIQEKTFLELFLPLDHSQCCPPLFLIFAKIIYFYGGLNEFFLRVIPFTASILSIFLFAYLSFLVLKNKIFVLFSSIVFSISLPLLLYSWIFKQYSFDVLITILILIITIKLKDKKLSYSQIITISLFFFILLLYSYTSVFIAFSSFLVFIFYRYTVLNNKNIFKEVLFFVVPYLLFVLSYFYINCLPNIQNASLQNYWNLAGGSFEIFIPNNYNDFKNLFIFLSGGDSTGAYFLNYISMIILTFCSICLLCIKNKFYFALLFLPFAIAYLFAYTGLYPLAPERVSLYLSPISILLIFYGVDSLSNDFRKRFLSSVFIIFLLFNYKSITFFFDNYFQRFEQVKYTLAKEYIYLLEKSDYKKDDYVFLDYGSYNCFDLYDKKI